MKIGDLINERGNTWLRSEEGTNHYFVASTGPNEWLEVSIYPHNYPGFNVSTVECSEEEIARQIRRDCDGWTVVRCNIDGVEFYNNCVVGE